MNKILYRMVAIGLALIIAMGPVNVYAAIKRGSKGTNVKMVQSTLKDLGYFTYSRNTGYYGKITEKAVKSFQKANGLKVDGIVGKNTISRLNKVTAKKSSTSISTSSIKKTSSDVSGDLDWYKEVISIWKRGTNAVITDVNTGKSFRVKRTYGSNHADVETLSRKDTQIVKEIWGGFSWERRAVVVEIGEYTLAGSMTAMPHAGRDNKKEGVYINGRSAGYGRGYNFDAVKGNGMDGHMDIHFKNSRTHSTNVVRKEHQNMVQKARNYIENNLV